MTRPSGRDYPYRRNAEGKPLCRWCGSIVTPPRRTFCSDNCVAAFKEEVDFSHARHQVFARDRGICAACGANTLKIRRILSGLHHGFFYEDKKHIGNLNAWRWYAEHLRVGRNRAFSGDLWDADHIVEVVRGGTNKLENLQTLCVSCHKEKTKRLAQERAKERRDSHRLLFEAVN
jgi:5-methylcytosine-specific restriction enzyme A